MPGGAVKSHTAQYVRQESRRANLLQRRSSSLLVPDAGKDRVKVTTGDGIEQQLSRLATTSLG